MTRLADALRRAQHPAQVGQVSEPFQIPEPAWDSASTEAAAVEPVPDRKWLSHDPIPVGDASVVATRAPHDFSDRLACKLVTDPGLHPLAVEQYRRLAAALHHAKTQSGIKVVMVTSAVVAEGKSLSVCNLGLTLSHSYRKRVLLIDADLRRPSLQEMFKLPPTAGLSEGLHAKDECELPLYEVSPGLVVLPAGRPDADPVGGLTSGRIGRVIVEAAEDFDWVLIDTPPLGLVPDAALLGALADTVLLVVRAGASPCALVRQAIETLGADKIFGVLLNAAATGTVVSSGSDYSYGYSKRT
ncbi:MAG: CpsD/CapB family tyrosine-protein kinase [Acidobacteriota bacterium]|nr:CpsD/CapB family tyrosine-protein kinase [Acidobacteriota bacterium]